jgi:lysophospholipase L1-like esterase
MKLYSDGSKMNYFLRISLSVLVLACIPAVVFGQGTGIIVFGDSITEGCYIEGSEECGAWAGGLGYWTTLQALLDENEFAAVVYNHGKGGEITKYGVNRLASILENYSCFSEPCDANPCYREIGYVLIMEGTNDFVKHQSIEVIRFNLKMMIRNSREVGVEPLLATIPPDLEPGNEFKEIEELNKAIRELAAAENVILVDQYNALAPYWPEYTPGCYNDQTHPNRPGFAAMGNLWYENLFNLLDKNSPAPTFPWLNLLLRSL